MKLIGIGSGLFLLFFLWTITIVVLLLTARAKPPYTSLGPVVLLISTSVTTLIMMIPRRPFIDEISSPDPIAIEPLLPEDVGIDWMHFWRALIIIINLIAAAIGISLIYSRWMTKALTRLRPPSVDFLQVNQLIVDRGQEPSKEGGVGGDGQGVGGNGQDNGPGTSQDGKGKKKRKRKNDQKKKGKKSENKEETGDDEQEE